MTSNRIVKASKFAVFVASVIVSFVGSAVTQQGDITAAARGKVTVEASLADYYNDPGKLVNGHWKNERYLSASPTGPLSLDFTFGDTFIPGEDIVVTGLTFIVGGNGSNLWGSFAERMPKVFTVSGSNDGGATWTRIASYASFTSYAVSSDPAELHTYSGSMSFANWKSYRTYRIDIAEATDSTGYFVQLGEVAFLGFYGGTVVRPDPVKIDITAAARAFIEMDNQIIWCDRNLSRKVDLSKALRVTGLDPKTFLSCREAVAHELTVLSERPDLVARFDTPRAREISAKTDAYLASRGGAAR